IWTVVAIGSFLLAVRLSDPTSVSTLPGIPERLLLLSGVSAAGYLGGKLARRAGPVIEDIRPDASISQLTVVGRGLDPAATFELAGTPLAKYLTVKEGEAPQVSVVAPPGATDAATTLRLKLA